MSKLSHDVGAWVRRHLADWRVIGILGSAFLLSQLTIAATLGAIGPEQVLRLQTTLSPATFAAIVQDWQSTGAIDSYWRHYRYDFIHPLWYGGWLAAAMAKAFEANRIAARRDAWLCLPLVAAGLDLVENLFHVLFLTWPSTVVLPLVVLSGLAATAKWLLAGGSLAVVVSLSLRAVRSARA